MGIGVSVFLLALGAILAFAVDASIAGLDLTVVGWILMIAGALGLVMFVLVWGPRNRRASRTYVERDDDGGPTYYRRDDIDE